MMISVKYAAIAAVCTVTAVNAVAQEKASGITPRERMLAKKAERFGGMIMRPNARPGKFAFVNAQSRVAASNLVNTVEYMRKTLHANFVLEDGKTVTAATAGEMRKTCKADVAVFLVDDATMPDMMLVSPESKWAVVNIAALATDGVSQPFVIARLNKEMVRAFAYVTGCTGSEYKGNLLDYIGRADQLDSYADMLPPMDIVAKAAQRLPALGVTPQRITTYQQACREGWAPAPTNDVQKAIWDKVHEMPTEPMKIKPETKKVSR